MKHLRPGAWWWGPHVTSLSPPRHARRGVRARRDVRVKDPPRRARRGAAASPRLRGKRAGLPESCLEIRMKTATAATTRRQTRRMHTRCCSCSIFGAPGCRRRGRLLLPVSAARIHTNPSPRKHARPTGKCGGAAAKANRARARELRGKDERGGPAGGRAHVVVGRKVAQAVVELVWRSAGPRQSLSACARRSATGRGRDKRRRTAAERAHSIRDEQRHQEHGADPRHLVLGFHQPRGWAQLNAQASAGPRR